jgi:hypothetical protein
MPRPHPISSPRISVLQKFRRVMKWMALFSVAVAAIAVLLVIRGDRGTHIHMMIATALGAGLSVLLAGALTSFVFLGAKRGRDEAAKCYQGDEDN